MIGRPPSGSRYAPIGAPPACVMSAATSATSVSPGAIGTSAADNPRLLLPGESFPRLRFAPFDAARVLFLAAMPGTLPWRRHFVKHSVRESIASGRLEEIACGAFFETLHGRRRQKAWFLPPALSQMDTRTERQPVAGLLPAQRIDADGRAHVDLRAVLALALPLVANSAVQMLLNLTDVWFIGHISTLALAGVAAVQWLVLVVVMILGSIGMAVQTVVAQAFGARRLTRASQAVWTALWGILCVTPLFVLAGLGGRLMLVPFGFDEPIAKLAADFWLPRVAGSCFGTAAWAIMGFFNGIGRPRVTVLLTSVAALANV